VEETRVNRLFAKAAEEKLPIEQRSLTNDELRKHITQGNVAILLVNANLLPNYKSISDSESPRYQGHYILICGATSSAWFYRDPDTTDHYHCIGDNELEAARKSFGTDEDVILLYFND
jgi:hypothetical protein